MQYENKTARFSLIKTNAGVFFLYHSHFTVPFLMNFWIGISFKMEEYPLMYTL